MYKSSKDMHLQKTLFLAYPSAPRVVVGGSVNLEAKKKRQQQ